MGSKISFWMVFRMLELVMILLGREGLGVVCMFGTLRVLDKYCTNLHLKRNDKFIVKILLNLINPTSPSSSPYFNGCITLIRLVFAGKQV